MNRKAYLTLLMTFFLTALAILDDTPIWVAVITVTIPVIASYWLIARFNEIGMVLVPILWALSVVVRNYLTETLTLETLKIVSVKSFGSVVLAFAYVTLIRNKKQTQ